MARKLYIETCRGPVPDRRPPANTTRFLEIGVSRELRAFNTVGRVRTSFGRHSTRRCRRDPPASSRAAFGEQSTAPVLGAGAARRATQRSRAGHRCQQIRGAGGSGIPNSERNDRVRAVEQLYDDWPSVGSPLHPEGSELQNRTVHAGPADAGYVSRGQLRAGPSDRSFSAEEISLAHAFRYIHFRIIFKFHLARHP